MNQLKALPPPKATEEDSTSWSVQHSTIMALTMS